MNKFREVRYVDDGVTQYQCLACKDRLDTRCGVGLYCMFCGIKWEGEVKPSDASKRREEIRHEIWRREHRAPRIAWFVERRWCGEFSTSEDQWEVYSAFAAFDGQHNATTVLGYMRRVKADAEIRQEQHEPSPWKWRIRMGKPSTEVERSRLGIY